MHLQERSNYYGELRHIDSKHILQQIIHTEETHKLYRKLYYTKNYLELLVLLFLTVNFPTFVGEVDGIGGN